MLPRVGELDAIFCKAELPQTGGDDLPMAGKMNGCMPRDFQ